MKHLYVFTLVSIIMACNKSGNNYNTGNTTLGKNNTTNISVKNYSFNPSPDTVKVGSNVVWTNNDPVMHTVTDENGTFDSQDIASGAKFNYTFTTVGTFHYHCKLHTFMTGTIVVVQ